jgi:cytochrome c biogenesis protein CcdA
MLRLIGLVVSIGLADSLNPSTIAPALYLATGEHPTKRVAGFTLGVFGVYLLGGLLFALGPGQLILSIVPHPDAEDRHVLEIIVGAAMIVAAAIVWYHRGRLSDRQMPEVGRRSSAVLGATITAVELPTAFPYFAALAAIVGSGIGLLRQFVLILLFNVCFILPLVGIVLTLSFAGSRADAMLTAGRRFLERRWPVLLSALLLLAGAFSILLGATAFAARAHNRFGRFMRHFHHLLHP